MTHYDVWQATVAMAGMCARFGKYGSMALLGKDTSSVIKLL